MKLLSYIVKRILFMLIVMIGVSTIVFFITRVIPADPVGAILGGNAPIELVDKMRHDLGLDKSILLQFIDYINGILHGDFGKSLITKKPVMEDILYFLPATIELALFSMFFSIIIGIVAGVLSAIHRNKAIDHVTRVVSIAGVAMPVFWLGLIMLMIFYYKLGLFPGGGRHSLFLSPPKITGFLLLDSLLKADFASFFDCLHYIILPAFVLGYANAALISRIKRSSLLDVLKENYIKTARAKGLDYNVVIYRHAMRNSLIPVITVIGISFGNMLGGAVITETVFSWPGVGRYLVNALLLFDYPAITASTLFLAFIYSIANLLVDISYSLLDPRIKH